MGSDPARVTAWTTPWLKWLDLTLHREVLRLRARYELSADELHGLYVSDSQVDALLAERLAPTGFGGEVDEASRSLLADALAADQGGRLGSVGRTFGLTGSELAALFVSLAPELDARYPTLMAYLNDDVTRRWPTVDLAERLSGTPAAGFQRSAALVAEGLVHVVPAGDAWPWRVAGLVVSEPVRSFLLDAGRPGHIAGGPADDPDDDVGFVVDAARAGGLTTIVLAASPGGEPERLARGIAAAAGFELVRSAPGQALAEVLLTARLRGAAVYFPATAFAPDDSASPPEEERARLRVAQDAPVLTIFAVHAHGPWRALFADVDHEVVTLRAPGVPERRRLWAGALADVAGYTEEAVIDDVAGLFALHPGQIERAARSAARRPEGHDTSGRDQLAERAREQCGIALDSLAERVATTYTWADLVLPRPTQRRLHELASAVRHRHVVFGDWAFARSSGGRSSLRALFAGASGTGKTLAASVVAGELGLPLYRIDLSAVVSKYIGETEKNLDRVFRSAEGSNALLFFDEADALFGKRSDVKDAHDRYANIEIAYLLQRMETHDGVVILATNLSGNLDEAFSRRIQFEIEFPLPGVAEREQLWRLLIPPQAPLDKDVDLGFVARQFPIGGGDIRNVALDAAFLAAHEGTAIGMRHLVRALGRQRTRRGRLPSTAEFQRYIELVRTDCSTSGKGPLAGGKGS